MCRCNLHYQLVREIRMISEACVILSMAGGPVCNAIGGIARTSMRSYSPIVRLPRTTWQCTEVHLNLNPSAFLPLTQHD